MKDILYFNTLEDIKIVDMLRISKKNENIEPGVELKQAIEINNYNYVVGYNEGGNYQQEFITMLNMATDYIQTMYQRIPILQQNEEVFTYYFKCVDDDEAIIKLTITNNSILVDDREMSAENALQYINQKISSLEGKKYLWKWDDEYSAYLENQIHTYGMSYTEYESAYSDALYNLQNYLFAYILKPTVTTIATLDTLMTLQGGEENEEGEGGGEEGIPAYIFKNSFDQNYVQDIKFIENPNNINSTSWEVNTNKWTITKNNNTISAFIGEENPSTDLNYIMNDFLNDAGKKFVWLRATNNQTYEDLFSSFAPMIQVTYLSYNE